MVGVGGVVYVFVAVVVVIVIVVVVVVVIVVVVGGIRDGDDYPADPQVLWVSRVTLKNSLSSC